MANESWLLLRIPRTEGAKEMSAVLSAGGELLVEPSCPDIPTAIDRLLDAAKAKGVDPGKPTLVFPLDGRHGLAHVVLSESERRGFPFSRHPPRGNGHLLVDTAGQDSAPDLAPDGLPAKVDALGDEADAAMRDSELAEAMAILRQIVAVCARHASWWDPNALWALANGVKVAASTGAAENVSEACDLALHAIAQPKPAPLPPPVRVLTRLDEVASNCAAAGQADVAAKVLEAAVELARESQGDGHPNHLAMLNNYGLFLSSRRRPEAESVLRDLLGRTRATLGQKHPNVAVVLSNLAQFLEAAGRGAEAAPLRAEVAEIRGAG